RHASAVPQRRVSTGVSLANTAGDGVTPAPVTVPPSRSRCLPRAPAAPSRSLRLLELLLLWQRCVTGGLAVARRLVRLANLGLGVWLWLHDRRTWIHWRDRDAVLLRKPKSAQGRVPGHGVGHGLRPVIGVAGELVRNLAQRAQPRSAT